MNAYTKSAVDTLEEEIFMEFGSAEKGVRMRAAVNVLTARIALLEQDVENLSKHIMAHGEEKIRNRASALRDYSTSELMAEYMRRDGGG